LHRLIVWVIIAARVCRKISGNRTRRIIRGGARPWLLAACGCPAAGTSPSLRGERQGSLTAVLVDYGDGTERRTPSSDSVQRRTAALRAYQYFISPDWSGGVYASPGIAGSRPGALIAGCWASLMAQGESGYINACHSIVGARANIETAVRENPLLSADLEMIGRPLVSVVAFTSKTLNVYDLADGMSAKGWHLNALQSPPAIHVAVTLPIVAAVDRLVADLILTVEEEREKERIRIAEGKGAKGSAGGDAAALYGVAGSLPNKSVVVQLASGFLDTLYKA